METARRILCRTGACRVALKFLRNQVETSERTGELWERYNAVEGGRELPVERAPAYALHGWSSASVVLLGRRAFTA